MSSGSAYATHGATDVITENNWTFGTSAPGTGDFEFRWNLTDGNGNVITRLDIILALKALISMFESNGVYTTLSEG